VSGVLLTVDVAHPPRHPDVVEADLDDAAARVRRSASHRVLKIVHGYGSSGRGGSTREVARNWAFRRRPAFRALIEGERYALEDAATQELRLAVGTYADPDLGGGNRGITIVWVK
jgi:hypothetical protein